MQIFEFSILAAQMLGLSHVNRRKIKITHHCQYNKINLNTLIPNSKLPTNTIMKN